MDTRVLGPTPNGPQGELAQLQAQLQSPAAADSDLQLIQQQDLLLEILQAKRLRDALIGFEVGA